MIVVEGNDVWYKVYGISASKLRQGSNPTHSNASTDEITSNRLLVTSPHVATFINNIQPEIDLRMAGTTEF